MLRRWWPRSAPEREDVEFGSGGGFAVRRDAFGNATVIARSLDEVWTGWGYACASDRFAQMLWLRRVLRGLLASGLGDGVATDRNVGWGSARPSDLDLVSRSIDFVGAARRALSASGPTARAASTHFATGVNLWAQMHARSKELRLAREEASPWTDEDCALLAKGVAFAWGAAFADVSSGTPGERVAAARLDGLRAALGFGPGASTSNLVVVGAARSRTGAPILAWDAHAPTAVPAAFWEVALVCPELRVQGISVPGAPMLLAGQTPHVAFAATPVDEESRRLIRVPGEALVSSSRRDVVIPIRRASVRRETVRAIAAGPLVSSEGAQPVAFSVASLSAPDLDAGLAFVGAATAEQLAHAWKDARGPAWHRVAADARGDVVHVGREGLSHAAAGAIGVSSNCEANGIATGAWEPSASVRFERWHAILDGLPLVGVDDLAAAQCDTVSAWARQIARTVAPWVESPERHRFERWDGNAHRGSITGAVLYATLRSLLVRLSIVSDRPVPFGGASWTDAIARVVSAGPTAAGGALSDAREQLGALLGSPDRWNWGDVHRAHFRTRTGRSHLERLARIEPVRLGGDATTIAAAPFSPATLEATSAPVVRVVFDVHRPERSRAILVPGANGASDSLHGSDQVPLWAEGKLRALNPAWRN